MSTGVAIKSKKLLAFCGSHIPSGRMDTLREYAAGGYGLLALDVTAMGLAAAAGLPFSVIDDWVEPGAIVSSKARAAEWETDWFQNHRDLFTNHGICWPEFDYEAFHWFWRDVSLAYALGAAVRERGIRTFSFFAHRPPRPAVYYEPSDVCAALWSAQLKHISNPIVPRTAKPRSFPRRVFRFGKKLARAAVRRLEVQRQAPNPIDTGSPENPIVIAINAGEAVRFKRTVERLTKQHPKRLMGISAHVGPVVAPAWNVPFFPLPSGSKANSAGEQFLRGYRQVAQETAGTELGQVLSAVAFQFQYFCGTRWPTLVGQYTVWADILSRIKPSLLIVSSLQDGESQLPTVAANSLGIKTVAMPHSGSFVRDEKLHADHILLSYGLHRRALERMGVEAGRFLFGCSTVPKDQYPVSASPDIQVEDKLTILVLTHPIIHKECISPYVQPRSQLSGIASLASPPGDLDSKISIRFKGHPQYPDLPLYELVDNRLQAQLVKPDAELSELLKQTDLVVALNYCGTALVHTLKAKVPVLLFWNDPMIGRSDPYAHANLFEPGGKHVTAESELWEAVREFMGDPAFADDLRKRASDFATEYLTDSAFPEVDEVISECIA